MIRYGELSEDERQALPLGTRLHPFDGYAEIAAWLTSRMDHPEARLSDRMLLRELIDVVESGEVPRG